MRKIHLYLTILIALSIVTLFVACEKDEDIDLTMISVASEQATPSYTSAKIECRFATKATLRNVYAQYATSQDFAEYDEKEMANVDGVYTVTLDGLLDNTVYYVRYSVSNRYSSAMVEEISTFKTLTPSIPSLALDTVTSIWDTYATVQIRLLFDGGAPIQEMGVCWGTQAAPVVENNKLITKDTHAVLEIKDLQPNTKYYLRAYAKNKMGVAYSDEYTFMTYALPEIKTDDVTDIQLTSAIVSGTLVFDGNDTATVTGFCWGTNEEPTLKNEHAEVLTASASYTYHLSNLKNETKYYVRAYAQNRIGVVYGEVKSFTTLSAVIPTVTTSTVSRITETTAVAGGNVTSDGGASVTERGVVYSTSSNPTMANGKVASGSGTGAFTCNLTGLQSNTTYYIRAYAVNSKGTAYGDEVSFTTNEKVFAIPEYVDLGLSVKWATFNVGATKPEEYGDYFAWGETEPKSTYSWSNYKWCRGSETTLTKYCNHSGYGTVDNKTTLELSDDAAAVNLGGDWRMPTKAEQDELREQCTWTWTTLNGVNGYKVTSKSNGKSIFLPAAGHRIGSSLNSAGSDGNYWSSSLYADSPYYAYYLLFNSSDVHRYNFDNRYYGFSVRPVYGAQGEQVSAPTVVTSAVTQIEETTAVAGGNVTSDGGASVTERGVVYSTSANPTTANSKVASGSGTGAFTCNLTGLQHNTTYYVRAYAVNSKGTSYGNEVSFTTNEKVFATPEYVDLGLSVKWATCNVGASKPEESGDYFAWGETTTKSTYSWSTYTYCKGSSTTLTKYNCSSGYGTLDNKTTLELSDDVAAINWGGAWRMPTDAEITELREQCTWTWITQNGIKGYRVTSKKNSNSIFLPAASYCYVYGFYTSDSGNYWSSSLNTDNSYNAWSLYFNSDKVRRGDTYITYRYYGYSVRPVYGEYIAEAMMPIVTTSAITQITETTAVAGGNVTSDGGATVTERGVVYSTSQNPTTANSKVQCGSGTGAFSCNLSNLQENTTYYVRAYAINKNGTSYGEQNSFTTNKSTSSNTDYQYVDLGLSVKWATCNVGASKPEECGDYFAWGETKPKSSYSSSNYTYTSNTSTLPMSNDAARVNWGGSWRMPTKSEQDELRTNCTWTWTTQNGVKGYKVTSKSNGNSIFLPAAGDFYGTSLYDEGSKGYYWSSSLYDNSSYAYYLSFTSYDVSRYSNNRFRGQSVRPVCP